MNPMVLRHLPDLIPAAKLLSTDTTLIVENRKAAAAAIAQYELEAHGGSTPSLPRVQSLPSMRAATGFARGYVGQPWGEISQSLFPSSKPGYAMPDPLPSRLPRDWTPFVTEHSKQYTWRPVSDRICNHVRTSPIRSSLPAAVDGPGTPAGRLPRLTRSESPLAPLAKSASIFAKRAKAPRPFNPSPRGALGYGLAYYDNVTLSGAR